VVFKRRNRRGILRSIVEAVWPRGGWQRATSYVMHRLRRLPDTPHRICVGIAAGAFVSFWPTFGLHFLLAALAAFLLRGNILAALLGTFFGNPLTFPVIAVASMQLGSWIMGYESTMAFGQVMASIGQASSELMRNLWAVFTGEAAHWERLSVFFWRVFAPYFLGGTILGVPCSIVLYYLCLPLVLAYQRRRLNKLKERFEVARARDRDNLENDLP
jgi:uncharacterized protein